MGICFGCELDTDECKNNNNNYCDIYTHTNVNTNNHCKKANTSFCENCQTHCNNYAYCRCCYYSISHSTPTNAYSDNCSNNQSNYQLNNQSSYQYPPHTTYQYQKPPPYNPNYSKS